MIILREVTKRFGTRAILDGASLGITPGELVCIAGEAGSGKSLLLSLLLGMESPDAGKVTVDSADLRSVPEGAMRLFRQKTGVMFQDGKLLPYLTVAENIALPLELSDISRAGLRSRVQELLKFMGLTERKDAFPSELSRLERAKTALARAMAAKPIILLADAPADDLDALATEEIVTLLKRIHASGVTVIVATRDMNLAAKLGARSLRLQSGMISESITEAPKAAPVPEAPALQPVPSFAKRKAARVTRKLFPEMTLDASLLSQEHDTKPATELKPSMPTKTQDGPRKIRVTSIHSD